jgi:coenzyme F420-reducing hydrogenase alpha subunit
MNSGHIEESVRVLVAQYGDKEEANLKTELEKLVRTYDPCISCATHAIQVEILSKDRKGG